MKNFQNSRKRFQHISQKLFRSSLITSTIFFLRFPKISFNISLENFLSIIPKLPKWFSEISQIIL